MEIQSGLVIFLLRNAKTARRNIYIHSCTNYTGTFVQRPIEIFYEVITLSINYIEIGISKVRIKFTPLSTITRST